MPRGRSNPDIDILFVWDSELAYNWQNLQQLVGKLRDRDVATLRLHVFHRKDCPPGSLPNSNVCIPELHKSRTVSPFASRVNLIAHVCGKYLASRDGAMGENAVLVLLAEYDGQFDELCTIVKASAWGKSDTNKVEIISRKELTRQGIEGIANRICPVIYGDACQRCSRSRQENARIVAATPYQLEAFVNGISPKTEGNSDCPECGAPSSKEDINTEVLEHRIRNDGRHSNSSDEHSNDSTGGISTPRLSTSVADQASQTDSNTIPKHQQKTNTAGKGKHETSNGLLNANTAVASRSEFGRASAPPVPGDYGINREVPHHGCEFCIGKQYRSRELLDVHMRNVHKKCNCGCGEYFATREDYIEHFYEVFPLACFESRKCPERFRGIHSQAGHHAREHHAERPFYCGLCFYAKLNGEEVAYRFAFKDIQALKIHCEALGHDMAKLQFDVDDELARLAGLTSRRCNAINYC